jgi:adenine phosphoribosyltransferase
MKIVVGSTSRVKLGAVREVFPEALVIGETVESGVEEQPFSREHTSLGAFNRLSKIKLLHPDADCWIAIENGVFPWIQGSKTHVDQAFVVQELNKQKIVMERWSRAVKIPLELVEQAQKSKLTIGRILLQRGLCSDHADPHVYLGGGVSRRTLIVHALKGLDDPEEEIRSIIGIHPNFPSPGIMFYDILPCLQHPVKLKLLIQHLCEGLERSFPLISVEDKKSIVFVGVEARGFLFAPALALNLGAGCTVARKKGKIPGKVVGLEYKKEYGTDVIEMAKDSIKPGMKAIIVDDLIATGGTVKAAAQLVESMGGQVIGALCIIDLIDLHTPLPIPLHALFQF